MKLIECVPNISEGRDPAVIEAISSVIHDVEGALLLDVDPGEATNRTVITFVGTPDAVAEGAFRLIKRAAELIDMSKHSGAHARMGATDVCPFVPMGDATMDDCVELAHRVGKRVGEELGIPMYLYGSAAQKQERKRLPNIRKGEYEALETKLKSPEFAPDYGPAKFNARAGATAIGGREFLIAWNININSRNKKLAGKIAAELREVGKLMRDKNNKFVRDDKGKVRRVPGRFTELQGGGWYIDEYKRAQISFNIMNYDIAPMHEVYDAACEVAETVGVRVTGSELVGLIPREAILRAGDHYLRKQGHTTGVPEAERVEAAIVSMGLSELTPFDPAEKIIEYKYAGPPSGLKAMSLAEFADELSSDSMAPGGGSVAALCGSVSASLSSMVAVLTWTKKGMESARDTMGSIGPRAQELKDWFTDAVDADTNAFNDVILAGRMPKDTEEQRVARAQATELAYQKATRVPLSVLVHAVEAMEIAEKAAKEGNPSSASDAGVAGHCALAAAEGASLNVRINLPSLTDQKVRDEIESTRAQCIKNARAGAERIRGIMDAHLKG